MHKIKERTDYKILKYCFVLQYLIKTKSLFVDRYKLKLLKELIQITPDYSYILELNEEKTYKELEKIIEAYFNKLPID